MKKFQENDAILIITDMEGISGLIDRRLLSTGGRFWREYGRALLTEDINTVAAAIYSRGIRRIFLSENHNTGRNVIMEELLPFVQVLTPHCANTTMCGNSFWQEFYTKEGIIGAVLLGFPAMAGSGGYLAHSWDNNVFEYIRINGRESGAIGTTAALLGEYNIPVFAVIGDESATSEARELIPDITTVVVKRMEKDNWIEVLPPDVVHGIIFEEISKSLDKIQKIKPFRVQSPVEFEFRVKNRDFLSFIKEEKIIIKESSVFIEAESFSEAYARFWDCYMKMMFRG